MVTVRQVASEAELKTFIEFPYHHYKNDPNWTPPLLSQRHDLLDKKRNPAWEYLEGDYFIAWEGETPVGTISAFINHRHNDYAKEHVGWFGIFETVDDPAVSDALLTTAIEWVQSRGYDAIRGPQSFTTHEECGLLVDNFTPPMVLMPYNPPYYIPLIERMGFQKVMDVYSCYQNREIIQRNNGWERYGKIAQRTNDKSGISIRPLNMGERAKEFKLFRDIYNDAWANNWGFVPMTDRELDALVKNLGMFVDPKLAFFAELEGKPIGFALAIPNLNESLHWAKPSLRTPEWWTLLKVLYHWKLKKAITSVRLPLMGVLPEYRNRGVEIALIYAVMVATSSNPTYQYIDAGWILETNQLLSIVDKVGTLRYKTHRFYEKALK